MIWLSKCKCYDVLAARLDGQGSLAIQHVVAMSDEEALHLAKSRLSRMDITASNFRLSVANSHEIYITE